MNKDFLRMIDANANRTREALRVLEDCVRFTQNHARFTSSFKKLRHEVTRGVNSLGLSLKQLLESRESRGDVGKKSVRYIRQPLAGIHEILVRNFKRAQESLRVLEECSKGSYRKVSSHFQRLRFDLYDLEKAVLRKF